jgi:hypothetical protein
MDFVRIRKAISAVEIENLSLEQLGLQAAGLESLSAGYERLDNVDEPEWLADLRQELGVMIDVRIRRDKQRKLRELQVEAELLKPDKQKRKDVQAEIEALEKELNA